MPRGSKLLGPVSYSASSELDVLVAFGILPRRSWPRLLDEPSRPTIASQRESIMLTPIRSPLTRDVTTIILYRNPHLTSLAMVAMLHVRLLMLVPVVMGVSFGARRNGLGQ